MYHRYYRLTADPFRLSTDPSFCFRHPGFAKGRAYMEYGLVHTEGFVVVTGRPGMGKTTLINDLFKRLESTNYLSAMITHTRLDATELLRAIAYEFGMEADRLDKATLIHRLKHFLMQAYRADKLPLLIVDEAQNLTLHGLEELRLLTNLQIDGKPLLRIFLVGQRGLRTKLQDPRMDQLRQRITAAAHLEPLTPKQTAAYIRHRLTAVGWDNFPRIKMAVIPTVHTATGGVPRRVNQFCGRLLLYGSAEEKDMLTGEDALLVLEELKRERLSLAPGSEPHTRDKPRVPPVALAEKRLNRR